MLLSSHYPPGLATANNLNLIGESDYHLKEFLEEYPDIFKFTHQLKERENGHSQYEGEIALEEEVTKV